MGKMVQHLILLIFLLLLFYGAGLLPESGLSGLLRLLINPDSVAGSDFIGLIGRIFLATGAGIAVSFLFARQVGFALRVGLATFLLEVGFDLIIIFDRLSKLNEFFAIVIISPLLIIWMITLVEWVTSND